VGWLCKDKSATKNANVWGHVPNEGEWSLSNNKGIVPVKVLLAGTQRYQRRCRQETDALHSTSLRPVTREWSPSMYCCEIPTISETSALPTKRGSFHSTDCCAIALFVGPSKPVLTRESSLSIHCHSNQNILRAVNEPNDDGMVPSTKLSHNAN
jgi:hypothetical protein